MKNGNFGQEGSGTSHPLKKLGEKIVTNFQGANLAVSDFGKLQANARLGVTIDWTTGTMIVQTNK